jgi:hypothetical protein
MRHQLFVTTLLGLLALGVAAPASAHVALTEPPARYDSNVYIKDYPCGHAENPEGEVTRSYEEGSTIMVTWNEYIPHPGHYRIALSTEGDQALIDPTDYDDFYVAPNVLMDNIADPDFVADHMVELTLPMGVTCEKCTLQLLQIMTDKMPWGPEGGNEIYYQCADIAITPLGAVTDSGPDDTSGGDDLGESSSDDGGTDDGPDPTTVSASATGSDDESTGDPTMATTAVTTVTATGGEGDDDEGDGGCGCREGDGGALGWSAGLLALALVRRRR